MRTRIWVGLDLRFEFILDTPCIAYTSTLKHR